MNGGLAGWAGREFLNRRHRPFWLYHSSSEGNWPLTSWFGSLACGRSLQTKCTSLIIVDVTGTNLTAFDRGLFLSRFKLFQSDDWPEFRFRICDSVCFLFTFVRSNFWYSNFATKTQVWPQFNDNKKDGYWNLTFCLSCSLIGTRMEYRHDYRSWKSFFKYTYIGIDN